jgi:hypothetical protein
LCINNIFTFTFFLNSRHFIIVLILNLTN